MSVERELGQLTEAVSGLKTGLSDVRDYVAELGKKIDKYLEIQAKAESAMNFRVGKLAGTVTLIVSLLLAGVKEALVKVIHGH